LRIFGDVGPGSKTFSYGVRLLLPEETLARILPFKSRFGITRIANLTGLDRTGIPVVMVCRPNARSTAVFHGKGISLAAAKVSGLMEAIETWHAEHIQLPIRFASYAELGREVKTAEVDLLPRIPGGRFNADRPMLWVEGRNLIDGQAVWVPFEMVHAHSTIDGPPVSGYFSGSTNGLASGNHVLEATSHALCELIERDATALWRQSPTTEQDLRRVDLTTVDDAECLAVLDLFARARIDVAVWDVTTDVGVPAFQCFAADRTGEIGHVGVGAGCHRTRKIALLRATTEAAQVRTTYIVGSREDIGRSDYASATLTAKSERARAMMRPVSNPRDFASVGDFDFKSLKAEVAWLVERLDSVGIRQAIAVDLTRSEFGVPVVRVVAPGLEGFDHFPAHYVAGPRARALRERRA
jgi:YcaO-like protein with predicted kinase domain